MTAEALSHNGAAGLSVIKLGNICMDPFLEVKFKLTNFLNLPDVDWYTVPLFSSPVTVALLSQCQCGVRYNDVACSIVSTHYGVQINGFT